MKYNLKTGRFIFEAVDNMKSSKTRSKNVNAKVPNLYLKRPRNTTQTHNYLEKILCNFKIRFNKKSNQMVIRRIMSFAEGLLYLRKAATYAMATCIMVVVVYGSVSALDLRFAKEVIVDGQPVGLIEDTSAFEQMIGEMQSSLSNILEQPVTKEIKPVYITRLIFSKDLTNEYRLRQNLLATYDEVSLVYAIYVDDKLVAASIDENVVNEALQKVKDQYKIDGVDTKIEFAQKVEVKKEYVPIGFVRSADGVFDALTVSSDQAQQYTIQSNDTLWDIASRFNTSVDELVAMNDNLTETIHDGDVINITKSKPALGVNVSYVSDSEQPIPYDVEKISDNSITSGKTEVVKEGIEGKKRVVEEIVALNGEIVQRNVMSEEILQQPVAGIVKAGTKIVSKKGTGILLRPSYGTITSRFGRRGRGIHTGLDIANRIGTPVEAADSGVVTFTGWSGGYGNLVKVSHGNGVETYYGHLSAILVKKGQTVGKGDVIAKVGSTGNSTGPHLHFEVRVNGTPKNPESYLK